MIRFFAGHPTAATLLMIAFLFSGAITLPYILRETQPDFAPTEVDIRIRYPGATAQEVEEVICLRVEDALDGISFVKEVRMDAREGMASIVVEMGTQGNIQTFIRDIETEIGAIDDFPDEVERPVISELGRTDPVLSLLVSGPLAFSDLKAYCEDFKDRLQEAGVALIDIQGFSDHQLRVLLSDAALRRAGISAAHVADRIAAQSKDIPLGIIETREKEILLRFVDQRRTPSELADLIVFADSSGGRIRLGDIARIEDLFELDEEKFVKDQQRSALLKIEKSKNQDAIRIAQQVYTFVEGERKRHPQMKLTITQDETTVLKDRLGMLVTNGLQGLVLVFATTLLFFNVRVSFWIALGLPISFMGAFTLIPHLDLSINMFTMVGLLMALGLLMDDAIIIAENIMTHRQRGKPPLRAAVDGTKEVGAGVISSFFTTICILGPLAFIDGQIGRVLKVVPMMLILVLAVSLIEAFLIFPAHMNHAMHQFDLNRTNRFRERFNRFFNWTRDVLLGSGVRMLLKQRYLFLSLLIGTFILSISMIASGKIKFQGFPELEGNVVMARLLMPQGTPLTRTEDVVAHILSALEQTNQQFKPDQPEGRDLVRNVYVQYNSNTEAFENGPHVATITVDLLTADQRSGSIDAYLAFWRKTVGNLPDVVSLNLSEPGFGPGGRPIEIRLRGDNLNEMKTAVADLKSWFSQFEGVLNLTDDLRAGRTEFRMQIREDAHGIGLDATDIARQLRAAFQGVDADQIQIGPEAYEIEVRLSGINTDDLDDLENFNLILSDGTHVPLTAVVTWETKTGWARIARFNGMRAVTLRGDVDTRKINTNELMHLFRQSRLNDFQQTYPDLKLEIAGALKEINTTRKSMLISLVIGLVGIFFLLSFQFRTFTEPFIVMLAIPFALIGVIWGHGLMGVPVSMPSLLGFIALGGVVVNDSILLVIFLKNARKSGLSIHDAAVQASKDRFRAVLLTSTTTIAGLLPLLLEKSLQAQILIPLVISTSFGLMASTVLVLLALPCMYLILNDFGMVEKIGSKAYGPEV